MSATSAGISRTLVGRTLSPRLGYRLVAGIVGLGLFASSTPSPLYGIYRAQWGFSPIVLTLVYATYAVAVLAMLLLAGPISDEVGRRPVLLAALSALLGSSVLFMLADSVAWLFVDRAVQGAATGLAIGAASAAMLDLHPTRHGPSVGLANGVVSTAGLGLGVLVSAIVVETLPHPLVLPWTVVAALLVVALAGVALMPEPVARRSRPRLRPQRPHIPAGVRRPFLLAALAVVSSWSIGGLFLSLGPQLAAGIFHSTDHLVTAIGVFAMAGSGALAQLAFRGSAPWRNASLGSVALATGLAIVVASAASGSAVLFLTGAVIAGGGFGVAFFGALSSLTARIPAEHRSGVMSAFYVVAYAALSVPSVAAGFTVAELGLQRTFEIFGSAIGVLALGVAFEAWRTRPRAQAAGATATPAAAACPAR